MERDVSLITGRRVTHALERLGHEVHALDIEEGTTERLLELAPDAAFVCLHGIGGEDGTVQALLETLGISYTGSGPLSSIRSMDKDYAKRAMLAADVPTPPFRTFLRRAMHEMGAAAALGPAADAIGYPLVVKPARQGSGLGLTKVEEQGELLEAVYEAFGYDGKILLERWVSGTEITDFAIPAEISQHAAARTEETALAAYRTLGCSGFGRVDMILEGETPWVLDANTIPGFTETSTLPLAAEAAGISFEELVETILDAALQTEAPAKL
jgi:D-alanine-D-alanine ligase